MHVNTNKLVHITHNDGDAVGCALVAHYAYLDSVEEIYFCDVNEANNKTCELIDKWETNDSYPGKIIISDISVQLETWIRLLNIKKSIMNETGIDIDLMMIDHHLTNPCSGHDPYVFVKDSFDGIDLSSAALNMIKHVNFATKISAAVADNNFSKHLYENLFAIINDISRYDTWEWKHHPEPRVIPESLVADVCKFIGPKETYHKLIDYLWDHGDTATDLVSDNYPAYYLTSTIYPTYFINLLNAITIKKENSMASLESFVRVTVEGEYVIASFIASNEYTNDIADKINTSYDVDIVRILYPSSCKVGFRTARTDINLGRYAKRFYNGGGHPQAAGAKMSIDSFVLIYESVMNSPTLQKWLDDQSQ